MFEEVEQHGELDAPQLALPDVGLDLVNDPYRVLGRHARALQRLDERAAAVSEGLLAAGYLELALAARVGLGHQPANGSSSRPSITSKRLRITLPVKPQMLRWPH